MRAATALARAAAIALATAVMVLTPTLAADVGPKEPSSPDPSGDPNQPLPAPSAAIAVAASAASASTPLALRPVKPLELASEPPHASAAWKVGAVLSILGAAVLWLHRTRRHARLQDPRLGIVRRVPVGFRSELVVVDVEGQRLLLGVTPHAIQSLAVLDEHDIDAPSSAPSTAAWPAGDRFDALLDAARPRARSAQGEGEGGDPPTRGPKPGREEPSSAQSAVAPAEDVAGQARGLLVLRGRK